MPSKNTNGKVERHVVLVAPEIHWNTGNIGRTCLAVDAHLHLIGPLGFSLDDRKLKRAGLDYWKNVKLEIWNSFDQFRRATLPQDAEIALFSKTGAASFRHLPAENRLFLVFGSETRGLPPEIRRRYAARTYHIPIRSAIRSLNLSTAVGIALYESLRTAPQSHGW
jgi:tRNA (cytidine/uridine-2'-O-)-methyltransferase